VGPKSLLHLEALTSYHKLPRGPTRAGGPSRLRSLTTSTFSPEGPMLPQPPSASQAPRRFGVGIDTSRYGHYAAFLDDDLQPAAAAPPPTAPPAASPAEAPRPPPADLPSPGSAAASALLRGRRARLARRHGPAHFVVRLDAAGQSADNLRHFLHGLANPTA